MMTNDVRELIAHIHDMADQCSDISGCIQDEVCYLIDEDCDLTPNECAALEQIDEVLVRVSVDIDEMWSLLLKILKQNIDFYGKDDDDEGND